MKKLLLLFSVLFVITLAACGDSSEKNSREVKSSEDGTSNSQDVTEMEQEEVEEKEKPIGTRSNPLPFGDTITVKKYIYDNSSNSYESFVEITLLETIRGEEAWAIIQKENMYNEPADEGFEYAMVKVKGFLKESETEDDSLFFSSMDFNFVSNEGEVYDLKSVVIPNELSKELYSGGTGEGYIGNQVRVGDDFKVSFDSSEGSPVFFFVK